MSFSRLNFRVPTTNSSTNSDSGAGKQKASDDKGDSENNETDRASIKKSRRAGGKHQMAACCSCKKKRKKCDGNYPVCSGCKNSQVECTIFDLTTGRTIPRNYIQQLEEKVSLLHKELDILRHYSKDQEITVAQQKNQQAERIGKKGLETDIGFITLGVAAESHFIGQSSAFSIARAITNSIHYYDKVDVSSAVQGGNNDVPLSSSTALESFSKPSMLQARKYLDTYESSVQCQYPFLDWEHILQWFYEVQVGNSEDPKRLFFIYMIYAVGSQIYLSSSKAEHTSQSSTRSYYNKAFENITDLLKVSTLETVQVYLLLSVFSQHMPDGTSIWQTTGLAIRTAVTLGLHTKPYRSIKSGHHHDEMETRRLNIRSRVFWSAYSLERINGIVLGRPFGISDIDIDLPLPSSDPEIPVACHVFKLRRIQSSICTFVYKPVALMENPEEIDSTRVSIVLELNEWMSTFPAKQNPVSRFETFNWCSISYHNSMLLLLRPVVLEVSRCKSEASPRLIEWFKAFTHSASAVCMNYKDLYAKGKLNATWLSMHCLFVSGLSFLYCLWIDNQLKVLEWKGKRVMYDTISACSTILYVLAERWSSAAVFRDTFEQLSSAVMLKLEDPQGGAKLFRPSEDHDQSGKLIKGALDFSTIGIDQYLSYESQVWKSDSDRGGSSSVGALNSSPEQEPEDLNTHKGHPNSMSFFDNFDSSLWEFLDTTGDRFLRDIYQDLEINLGSL